MRGGVRGQGQCAAATKRPSRIARRLRVNQTDAETVLWNRIRNRQIDGYKFVRQVPILGYICDFVCREKRLIIEVDGGQHNDISGRRNTRSSLGVKKAIGASILEQRCAWKYRRRLDDDSSRALEIGRRRSLNLAPLAGRGRIRAKLEFRVRGYRSIDRAELAERAPHPNPLPVKDGERERRERCRCYFVI